MTNTELREVEFDISSPDLNVLRQLPGYADFDPVKEILKMLKPIYGLKDAPRAWRHKLHHVLVDWGMNQLKVEAELYVSHYKSGSGDARRCDPTASGEQLQDLKDDDGAASQDKREDLIMVQEEQRSNRDMHLLNTCI